MLAQLSGSDWQIVLGLSFVGAVIIAFMADSVLGGSSFGVALNAVMILAGGIGGLFALEWAIKNHHVYVGSVTTAHWLGAWLIGATALLLTGALIRGFVNRHSSNLIVSALSYLVPVVIVVGLTVRGALTILK